MMNGINVGHPIFEGGALTTQEGFIPFFANVLSKKDTKSIPDLFLRDIQSLAGGCDQVVGTFIGVRFEFEKAKIFIFTASVLFDLMPCPQAILLNDKLFNAIVDPTTQEGGEEKK